MRLLRRILWRLRWWVIPRDLRASLLEAGAVDAARHHDREAQTAHALLSGYQPPPDGRPHRKPVPPPSGSGIVPAPPVRLEVAVTVAAPTHKHRHSCPLAPKHRPRE